MATPFLYKSTDLIHSHNVARASKRDGNFFKEENDRLCIFTQKINIFCVDSKSLKERKNLTSFFNEHCAHYL